MSMEVSLWMVLFILTLPLVEVLVFAAFWRSALTSSLAYACVGAILVYAWAGVAFWLSSKVVGGGGPGACNLSDYIGQLVFECTGDYKSLLTWVTVTAICVFAIGAVLLYVLGAALAHVARKRQ